MKKILFALSFLCFGSLAHAIDSGVPISSYTDAATPGPIIFSSAPVKFIGIIISSTSPNSYIAFFRSTTPVFTPDIATQTIINSDYVTLNNGPTPIPLWDMTNSSYTFISKVGTAQITLFFTCPGNATGSGVCPGLPKSGSRR